MANRLLETLQRLLELPAADPAVALSEAADEISRAVGADKTDIFLHRRDIETLEAIGRSEQPLSALQRQLGLHLLPLANGGRIVSVFRDGATFVTGRLDRDDSELRGIKDQLKVRSLIAVPLDIGGARRGVVAVASQREERYGPDDVRFVESVARWIAAVAHRAELVAQIAESSVEQGRRAAAEELMTTLAHDLRNHLSPITVRLGLMRRRAERDERERDVRDFDVALRALARLGAMISDMLDVARIERGMLHVDLQAVDLAALIEETATTLSTTENPIDVRASQSITVAVDPDRIRQCIENVLANAIRHSPKGAPVVVTLEPVVLADGADGVRVEIADEGPGVEAALLPRLFDRFFTSSTGGLGMGLFLAKRIAILHGGDLTAESPPGKGARFTLVLRVAR